MGVLLFAAFVLAVNLYVQSIGVQNRIRVTLSEVVGMPVGMFRATFSPWGGFRLDQIKIASDLPAAKTDFLRAECLEVRCEFIPLFQGRVVLKRIALDAPQFVFQKNELGQYRFPRHSGKIVLPLPPSPLATTKPALLPEAIHSPNAKSAASPTVPSQIVELKPKLPERDLDIRKLLVRDANFRFLAQDGTELLRMEKVRCSLNAKAIPNTFGGVLEIKKMVIFNTWEIFDLEAAITLNQQKLQIRKLAGNMGEGRVEGEANADWAMPGKPFNLWLRLNKGDLGKLFPQDSDFANELIGLVHARLEYEGFITDEARNKGHAELKVTHAKIVQLPLLQLISQLAGSEEFSNFSVKKTEIKADITGSQIQINPSYLMADHVQITFAGPVNTLQKLDLQAQLIIDEKLFKKLPSEARENFVIDTTTKQQKLDFVITGSLASPQTNLVDRLIGEKLRKKFKSFLGDEDAEPTNAELAPKK